ncbi:HpcH/HpaI aldolase/citrate lyase family protein [Kordiimonas laminariae]|uniref:HpcH/HpaI aldolase/citrate lyase family protein n=1 Tax=Kordiimonas laminariae TaxID=2917717 RepID=UPI00248C24DF|nr:CoA ester lyase [Kordiimonas laminariae]
MSVSDFRPRRSVLFMPASNARALEKAKTLACDAVIFDLEDAVSPDAKEEAREQAVATIKFGEYGHRERIIRINGLNTDWWQDDLVAAASVKPDAILVPKIETANDVKAIAGALLAQGDMDTAIWAMMETPLGFLNAQEIVGASERLKCVVIGTNDLVKDLGASHTPSREPVITALGLAMLAARTRDITILDGVYNDFKNTEGLHAECEQAKAMGFDGKTLIHPSQIETANNVFAPSIEEVAFAERMISAFDKAKADGKGVAVLDGKMIEELHVEQARKIKAAAEAIADIGG